MKYKLIIAAAIAMALSSCESLTFGVDQDGVNANYSPKGGLTVTIAK